MIHMTNPRQNTLFDTFEGILSPLAYDRLLAGWQGLFRQVILERMPAEALSSHFDPAVGCPTKELYSMAGLILIMEFKNWTCDEAVDAYLYDASIQYALNLEPAHQSLSTRSLERYRKLFREDDLATVVMSDVTAQLAELLELDVSKQRLDSTHVKSDMATFGRTRLMGISIRRFLTQLKRHDRSAFDALPEAIRDRYASSEGRMFADVKGTANHRMLRQQVAEDLYDLIGRFENDASHQARSSFQALVRVFSDQCEVIEARVAIKEKTGGNVLQNPSDPDATYDGHKGAGYQVQLSETTSEDNEVQLITAAVPQTAVTSDAESLLPVLERLEKQGMLPDDLLADTSYGSDENDQACSTRGIELSSPVSGPVTDPHTLNEDDFVVNEETNELQRCPAGHAVESSTYDAKTGLLMARMPASACSVCPFVNECPVRNVHGRFEVRVMDKQRRLESRRREQDTEAFRERYRKRSGIEGTNSGLKRTTGMDRVRVRGAMAVFASILLKVTGWNILRAAASAKLRGLVAKWASRTGQNRIPVAPETRSALYPVFRPFPLLRMLAERLPLRIQIPIAA